MAPKAVSGLLAFALAATMCPAAGLAYAAEGEGQTNSTDNTTTSNENVSMGSSSSDRVNEDVKLDTSGSSSSTDENTSDGSTAEGTTADEELPDISTSDNSDATGSKYTNTSDDRISADIVLDDGATVGKIEYKGFVYTIDTNDAHAVSITGLGSTKPSGDVAIPSQIAHGGDIYNVTSISLPNVYDGTNPYAENVFDRKDKALAVNTISIPASIRAIHAAFFQLFPNATEIYVASDNETYTSYDGAVYNADLTQLILVPQGKGSLVLPNELTTVPAYAFSQCAKLSVISFPGSTGNNSFAVWNNVLYTSDYTTLLAAPAGLGASATIAPEVKTIAEGAFYGNVDLDTIIVNGVVEEIAVAGDTVLDADGNAIMAGSTVLGSTLPAFSNTTTECAAVVINISADGDEAAALIEQAKAAWVAYGFTNFKESAVPGTEIKPAEGSGFAFTLLPDYTLSVRWEGPGELPAALDIPDYGLIDGVQYTVSTIADNAFSNYTSLVTVDIPHSVTTIGNSAFELCTNLHTVHFDSVITIGDQAFANTALLSLVLPTTVQAIGANAFSNMKNATIVALGSVADNSEIALGAASGLSIYVPLGTEDDWDAGIPTLGNHIYPYGIELSGEPIKLEVGQTANIAEGGYLEAPGAIDVSYAYRANPISINTETGDVEAKAEGTSNIDVTLSIELEEVVVERMITGDQKLKPAGIKDSLADGSAGDKISTVFSNFILGAAGTVAQSSAVGYALNADASFTIHTPIENTFKVDYYKSGTSGRVAETRVSVVAGGSYTLKSADGSRTLTISSIAAAEDQYTRYISAAISGDDAYTSANIYPLINNKSSSGTVGKILGYSLTQGGSLLLPTGTIGRSENVPESSAWCVWDSRPFDLYTNVTDTFSVQFNYKDTTKARVTKAVKVEAGKSLRLKDYDGAGTADILITKFRYFQDIYTKYINIPLSDYSTVYSSINIWPSKQKDYIKGYALTEGGAVLAHSGVNSGSDYVFGNQAWCVWSSLPDGFTMYSNNAVKVNVRYYYFPSGTATLAKDEKDVLIPAGGSLHRDWDVSGIVAQKRSTGSRYVSVLLKTPISHTLNNGTTVSITIVDICFADSNDIAKFSGYAMTDRGTVIDDTAKTTSNGTTSATIATNQLWYVWNAQPFKIYSEASVSISLDYYASVDGKTMCVGSENKGNIPAGGCFTTAFNVSYALSQVTIASGFKFIGLYLPSGQTYTAADGKQYTLNVVNVVLGGGTVDHLKGVSLNYRGTVIDATKYTNSTNTNTYSDRIYTNALWCVWKDYQVNLKSSIMCYVRLNYYNVVDGQPILLGQSTESIPANGTYTPSWYVTSAVASQSSGNNLYYVSLRLSSGYTYTKSDGTVSPLAIVNLIPYMSGGEVGGFSLEGPRGTKIDMPHTNSANTGIQSNAIYTSDIWCYWDSFPLRIYSNITGKVQYATRVASSDTALGYKPADPNKELDGPYDISSDKYIEFTYVKYWYIVDNDKYWNGVPYVCVWYADGASHKYLFTDAISTESGDYTHPINEPTGYSLTLNGALIPVKSSGNAEHQYTGTVYASWDAGFTFRLHSAVSGNGKIQYYKRDATSGSLVPSGSMQSITISDNGYYQLPYAISSWCGVKPGGSNPAYEGVPYINAVFASNAEGYVCADIYIVRDDMESNGFKTSQYGTDIAFTAGTNSDGSALSVVYKTSDPWVTWNTPTYTINIKDRAADTANLSTLYLRYTDGLYTDAALKNRLDAGTWESGLPADRAGYTFDGFYGVPYGSSTPIKLIDSNGHVITSSFTSTLFRSNVTLTAGVFCQ